jgi:hypothetical protein
MKSTLCRSKGIAFNEIEIAWDMITIVVNKKPRLRPQEEADHADLRR